MENVTGDGADLRFNISSSFRSLASQIFHCVLCFKTHKSRVHKIDPVVLAWLWGQLENSVVSSERLELDLIFPPTQVELAPIPEFMRRDGARTDDGTKGMHTGFSLDLRVRFDTLKAVQVLLDNRQGDSI